MGNQSTVFSIKGDIKDLEGKLKSIKGSVETAFQSYAGKVGEVAEAERALADVLARQEATIRPLREEQAALNRKKAEGGKLTAEESARLKELNASILAHNRAAKAEAQTLRNQLTLQKRVLAARKAELSHLSTMQHSVKGAVNSRNEEVAAIKTTTKSVQKENAERRALGTTLVRHIRRLESLAVAYYAVTRAYEASFGAGVKLNRQYENMELGLAALLASKTKAVDATGKETDALMRFNVAQIETSEILTDIKRAALDTPATFMEMAGFYQQAIGHALAAGQAFGANLDEISDNTITLTKRLSALGASVGMSMDLINEEIRSLMSGDVSRDSKLALILFGSPTVANAAIKEAKKSVGGLTKLFDEKLIPFAVLENIINYDKALNHLVFQIEEIQRKAAEPIFDDLKQSFQILTEYLKENGQEITDQFVDMYRSVITAHQVMASEGRNLVVAFDPVVHVLKKVSKGMLSIENMATGTAMSLSTMAHAVTNAFVVMENAALQMKQVKAFLDPSVSAKEYDRIKRTTDIMIEFNRQSVMTLDEIITRVEASGVKARQTFAVFEDLHKNFDKDIKIEVADDKQVIEMFNRLETRHAEYTERYKGNVGAMARVDEAYLRTQERLLAEYTGAQGIKLQQVMALSDGAQEELEKIAELEKMAIKARGDGYEILLHRREELISEADGNARQLLLINEWYFAELEKLNKKSVDTFEKARAKELKDEEKAANDKLKLWEGYYVNIGNAEKAWAYSDERRKALAEATSIGLDDTTTASYMDRMKKKYVEGMKDMKKETISLETTLQASSVGMSRAFGNFFDHTSEGFLKMENLALGVIESIMKAVVQAQLVTPIVTGLTAPVGQGGWDIAGAGLGSLFATGGAFENGVQKFATGGVVSAPTMFPMANGTGLMGEAGPEAIMPLTRVNGDLGVKATPSKVIINVSNESVIPLNLKEVGREETDKGDIIIQTVLHNLNYNGDFKNAIRNA